VKPLSRLICVFCVACGALAPPLRAQDTVRQGVRIGLTYDRTGKPGVAITPVAGVNGDSVARMLVRDLDFSDRITVIAADSSDPPTGALNYELYARLNAVAVVHAVVTPANALHVAVHEVAARRVVLVVDLPLPQPSLGPEWRQAVHAASDSVEWAVLGERGIANTRILFARDNQIWMVDSDGANEHPVPGTAGGKSPAWHPNGKTFAYAAVRVGDAPPQVVARDLDGARRWSRRVGSMNITPTFSPDGSQLLFSSGTEGMDLYSAVPFGDDPPRRLTSRRGSLNMSPTMSPDGGYVAFTSDLIGHPEVYIMDADGSNAEILTSSGFGDQLYRSDPAWSPAGRRVAFQSRINGAFQVMTIAVTDRSTSQLTSEGENEDPSWAPDGRHIVFVSTRSGSRQLWVLDTESSRTRQLTRGAKVQNPAWSPRLEVNR
jgi:TolB protein